MTREWIARTGAAASFPTRRIHVVMFVYVSGATTVDLT